MSLSPPGAGTPDAADAPAGNGPVSDGVMLYWLPLGAGGHCVRRNGRVFELLVARHERRQVRDLYHSALEVRLGTRRFVIEMTPVLGGGAANRGVVCEGPVGCRRLRRSKLFRYEIRSWRDGTIPDVAEAVASPSTVSVDAGRAREVLRLVPLVPTLTWGRDESRTGEMWNSNSLTAWLLARSGHHMNTIRPPERGRAPGWNAGLVIAARQQNT
ncbi:hypothetical protein [Actinoplanes derwentensis]|uniref:Uncharacterized protein n=1 Tax=Actinoplanes derwentensis TaxID=113562 RepID=A0A1H1UG65_9ACTN|nr:hypothetical protein [Actinoplanes derwentensis]GID85289.1 hypothetical protein Ade03nite_42130 [Actinoplanes derwentensis]SDS71176.1 hypothetical protein SAMN04489716_1422 [Actinoplanes derwentensis]